MLGLNLSHFETAFKVEHKRLKRIPNNSVNAANGKAEVEKSKEQGCDKQA